MGEIFHFNGAIPNIFGTDNHLKAVVVDESKKKNNIWWTFPEYATESSA